MSETNSVHDPYFTARGLSTTAPEKLNAALKTALDALPAQLYGEPLEEFTPTERAVLAAGGVELTTTPTRDPMAETAVQFAAIIASSLSTKAAAERLGIPENQVRQMIARRTLYSLLLNGRRYIPLFQFEKDAGLVPNITKVNAALPLDLHPVEVHDWYTQPDSELFLGEDIDTTLSPLAWLRSGGDVKRLVRLAQQL